MTPLWLQAQEAVSPGPLNFGQVSETTKESTTVRSDELGTGVFSQLPFKLSFNVRSGYDDNITTSKEFKKGSGFTSGGVDLTYDFGDARTTVSLQAGASVTYYWEHIEVPGINVNDYDINTYVRLGLTHKASPRLTLSVNAFVTYLSEPDFTTGAGTNRRSGNYFYTQDKFTATYLWAPRFATATSYTLGALRYDDSNIGFFEDRWENTFGNEFRFLISPTTSLVAEYRYEIISYVDIPRDSTTHFVLGGLDHTFDPQWNVSIRGGAEFRNYDAGGDETAPYFEGTLNYNAGKRTVISWINRYGLEEPEFSGNQSRKTFRTGLSARHDFTAKISGSLGLYYEHDDYLQSQVPGLVSPAFTEESVDLAISLRYSITRYFALEAGYNFTDVWSDVPVRDYTRNRYWGGLNVTF